MTDKREYGWFSDVDPSRRVFMRRFAATAFIAPLIASFALDGVAVADSRPSHHDDHKHDDSCRDDGHHHRYGNMAYGNQCYGNQHYGNQHYGNQWYGNQHYGNGGGWCEEHGHHHDHHHHRDHAGPR